MLSINTNLNAQNAANQIANSQNSINSSSERLTTGLRINTAADDVSGMGLAIRLQKTEIQTAQYIENAANGISMIQTADAAMKQQTALLERMQELAYKAENGSNSTQDVALIQKEFDQLAKEMERTEASAEYNGTKLLDGSLDSKIAVGSGNANQIGVTVGASGLSTIIATGTVAVSLTGHADGDAWKTDVHDILQAVATTITNSRADLGAVQNRLDFTTEQLQAYKQNISESLSLTQDTDFAAETTALAKANVLKNASQSMLSQANKSMEDVVNKLLQ